MAEDEAEIDSERAEQKHWISRVIDSRTPILIPRGRTTRTVAEQTGHSNAGNNKQTLPGAVKAERTSSSKTHVQCMSTTL